MHVSFVDLLFFAFLFYLLLYRALFILKASAQQHKENKNNIYCIIYIIIGKDGKKQSCLVQY
jgi:hypothetical protein